MAETTVIDDVLHAAVTQQAALQVSTPSTFTPAEIVFFTDAANGDDVTFAEVAHDWNRRNPTRPVNVATIRKYCKYFQDHGRYFLPSSRGPKPLLNQENQRTLLSLTERLRSHGWSVTAQRFRFLARGVVRRSHGDGFVEPVPGLHAFSVPWASAELRRLGFNRRAATTDRTVAADLIVAAGATYFARLRELQQAHQFHRSLIFNVDEFFVLLHDNSRFTWEKVAKGAKKNIAIAEDKLGFTCSVMTSMAGEVSCLQLNWRGKTADVHAKVENPSDKIFQSHRPESHFQNCSTWRSFIEFFLQKLVPIRQSVQQACGLAALPPVLLLSDRAPQHTAVKTMFPATAEWLHEMAVPPAMTHVFQPADMLVIAHLKQRASLEYAKWLEETVR